MYSIRPYQAYSFPCWFSNNSVLTFLQGGFLSSFVAEVVIFFSILLFHWSIFYSFFGGIVMLLSSPITSFCKDHVIFLLIHLTGVSCPFFQVFFILSSFASLFNRIAVWNLSYPLCHSFNSSGGSVLLIASSILSSCQVHVQFLPFIVGVLSKLYHPYSFSLLFNRSVASIILLLTGVSSKCYNFAKFIFYPFHFPTGALS